MEVYLEFLNNQVLISSLFWINWKGEKWLETVQTKNVEACCEESNVLKTCDVVEVVGNFGFGLKKWTEIWRKTSSWHDIWPEIVRNCGSFSKFLTNQVLILSLLWFKNVNVVSNSTTRSNFNFCRFPHFDTVLGCCEQSSRQNGRPHDLTCKPTAGTISHRTFNPNAISFCFLFGLRKKTTSLRAELTAKRPATQLNVQADR